MSKEYRFIGKATPRKDATDIVTGKAEFISDIKLANMLYGRVLRSPYPHANIVDIDTSKSEDLFGVKAVLTYKDVPDWKGGLPPHVRVLDSKVRYVGDAVALVAAETEEGAEEGLELIDVKYERLPAVYDVEEAMKPDAPQLYFEFPGNVLPPGCPLYGPKALQEVVLGDVEKGFEEADIITEGTYKYENIPNPLPIEPPGVIVKWESSKKLIVWSATQTTNVVKLSAEKLLGSVDVRSIGVACGGSYGTKTNYWQLVLPAAALAKVTGRPVKLCYTKEEHLATFTLRLGSRIHGKVGIKKDGTVTAMSGEWLVNTGAFSHLTQGQVAVGCGEAQLMLRCPNWNLKPKVVCTNRNASGTVRGFGGQELKCAFIPILTEAMEKADVDPVEFFKKNFVKPGDGYYWRDGNWWIYRGIDFSKAIEKGAEVFAWKHKWKGWQKPTALNGSRRRGVGVGVHGNADIGEDVSEAYVRLNPNATAVIHICISEHGTGQRSSLCKMVAEILRLPLDRVNITPPDTLVNPFEFGPVGSRGTYAMGSAVIAAAQEAKQKLLGRAALMLKVNPEDLETEDGVDERVALHQLPSLDLWNDHFPGRFPGYWELKTKADWAEAFSHLRGTFGEPLGVQHACPARAEEAPARLRSGSRQPVPRLQHPGYREDHADHRHAAPSDHPRPGAGDGAHHHMAQALLDRPLVQLREDARPRRQPPAAHRRRQREHDQRHPRRHGCQPRPHASRAGRRRPRAVQAAAARRRAHPAGSSPPRRPTSP